MDACFFCGHKPMDKSCTIDLPVYQLTKYNHLLVARRFEYVKQLIPVPRCTECASVHAKAKKNRKSSLIAGAMIGFVVGIPTAGGAGFTTVIGGFIGRLASNARAKKLYSQLQIKGLNQTTLMSYPPVTDKLKEGWKLDKPGGSLFDKKPYLFL